jgi:hypothetical protein
VSQPWLRRFTVDGLVGSWLFRASWTSLPHCGFSSLASGIQTVTPWQCTNCAAANFTRSPVLDTPRSHPEIGCGALGEGHVGQSVEHEQMMVSGDIRATRAWIHHPNTEDTDRLNYVSVMARPYLRADGRPGGAVTLTSSRVDHFTNLDQSAAVAFDMTVRFINMLSVEVK